MMCLSGYGDADMINFYDENGIFIAPPAGLKPPPGRQISLRALSLGIRNAIPFSSFHSYQRTDSIWAQNYVTPLDDYARGFDHNNHNFIPAFSHIDCATGEVMPLNPPSMETVMRPPEDFGDNWSDSLERGDLAKLSDYFRSQELVRDYLSFINFRVGGSDNFVSLDGTKGRGITFEVPRNSLMTAVDYEIFDDLLIGNFMKTTLHKFDSLYDGDFNFAVTKFGDNGRVQDPPRGRRLSARIPPPRRRRLVLSPALRKYARPRPLEGDRLSAARIPDLARGLSDVPHAGRIPALSRDRTSLIALLARHRALLPRFCCGTGATR